MPREKRSHAQPAPREEVEEGEGSDDDVNEAPPPTKRAKEPRKQEAVTATGEMEDEEAQQEERLLGEDKLPVEREKVALAQQEGRRLFVGGISTFHCGEDEVRHFFGQCGEIEELHMPWDLSWDCHRGFAFLTFATKAGAASCLEFHDTAWHGKWLKIQVATDASSATRKSDFKAGAKPAGCAEVFVGNLPWNVTEDMLLEVFGADGLDVTSVRLARHQATGELRGFGFVTLGSEADAVSAVEKLNGQLLERRPMRLDYGGNKTVITRDQARPVKVSEISARKR